MDQTSGTNLAWCFWVKISQGSVVKMSARTAGFWRLDWTRLKELLLRRLTHVTGEMMLNIGKRSQFPTTCPSAEDLFGSFWCGNSFPLNESWSKRDQGEILWLRLESPVMSSWLQRSVLFNGECLHNGKQKWESLRTFLDTDYHKYYVLQYQKIYF